MKSAVTGFEITVKDLRKVGTFYSKVFGWSLGAGPHRGVHRIENLGKEALEGSFLERGDHIPDYVCIYVDVDDLAAVLRNTTKSGGSIVRAPFSPDGQSTVCIIEDPEGHLITVRQTTSSAEPTK